MSTENGQGGVGTMGSPVLRTVGLVAGRELRVRLRSRGFRITLVVLVVLVVGMSVVLHLVKGGTTIRTVGLLRADAGLSAPVRAAGAAAGEPVTIRQPAGRAQAVAEVRSGALSGFVESTPSGLAVTVDRQLDGTMRGALGGVARELVLDRQIRALGGDPAKVAAAAGAAGVKVEALRPRGGEHTQRMVLGIVAGLLLYGSFMMAGPMIAQGVVEEKSSRVVELLLATMRPGRLMVGKVLGIGALGLIQLVVVGGAGLAAADATGTLTLPLGNSLGTLGWCLVWFLAGFALYSLLFAAAGALVSRQEDLGGVQFPVIMPIIAAWVIGISILPGNPDSGGVAALSMVPFLSPVLMPMRLAIGSVPVWQSAVSLGLTLLLAAAMVRVAARIYRNSVLRSGARVSWREALARGA